MAGNLRIVLSYNRRVIVAAWTKTWRDLRLSVRRIFQGAAGAAMSLAVLVVMGFGTYSDMRGIFWIASGGTTVLIFLGFFLWNLSLIPAQWDENAKAKENTRASIDELTKLYAEGQRLLVGALYTTLEVDTTGWAKEVTEWRDRTLLALPSERAAFEMACAPGVFGSVPFPTQKAILGDAVNKLRLIVGRVETKDKAHAS